MVNFKKRLAGNTTERQTDPITLYDTLDRTHDKGPLRPGQVAVLNDWFANHRQQQDVIVKLHPGQGKTLIGLLMLQSQLKDNRGQIQISGSTIAQPGRRRHGIIGVRFKFRKSISTPQVAQAINHRWARLSARALT